MFEFHSINGQIVPRAAAQLDVHDIGFRRGYAAFDYLRIVKGQAIFLEDHLDRFEQSATLLHLTMTMPREKLVNHIHELIAKNAAKEAGLQLFLTGGIASDGFSPTNSQLVLIMTVLPKPRPADYDQGYRLISYRYQRDLPQIKSNNYLMAVYLSDKLKQTNASDVLYHDDKRVLETTRSNIFIVKSDNTIVTPDKDVLPGITRKQMLKLAPQVSRLELRDVALDELWNAKEIFITGTTKGAMPVTQIDGKLIGTGKPGDITKEMGEVYKKHVEAYMSVASV